MTKYTKGIKIYKFNIVVTDKNSFDECNEEIIKELERHPELTIEEKEHIIKEVLCR